MGLTKVMKFGLGSRTCLGKNISIMEMSKVIPQLIRRFDIRLEDLKKPWKTTNWWLVKQSGMNCIVKRRKQNTTT